MIIFSFSSFYLGVDLGPLWSTLLGQPLNNPHCLPVILQLTMCNKLARLVDAIAKDLRILKLSPWPGVFRWLTVVEKLQRWKPLNFEPLPHLGKRLTCSPLKTLKATMLKVSTFFSLVASTLARLTGESACIMMMMNVIMMMMLLMVRMMIIIICNN